MKQFSRILVVVDSSKQKHAEVERAIKLADQTDAKLHLVDIIKDGSLTVRLLSRDYAHLHQSLVEEKREELQQLVDHCKAHGIDASGEVLEGVSSQQTIAAAQRFQADLIVRSAKGRRSLESGNLGMSAQKLIRHLPCAVWIIGARQEASCRRIVAAVDASPHDAAHAKLNRRILDVACQLSANEHSKLLVCYVWSLYGEEMLRNRLPPSEFDLLMDYNRKQHFQSFEELLAEFDLHANGPGARMLEGEPSSAIPALCGEVEADLLICGTVARYGIPGLLIGNTAERIINRVDCSILALMPPV